jgi:hypothetical protein
VRSPPIRRGNEQSAQCRVLAQLGPYDRWYLYGASRCQARIFNNSIFLAFFLCYPFVRPRASSFRPDPRSHGRRAQGRSRMAVAQVVHQYRAFPGHSLTCPEPRRQARGRSGRLGGVHPTASKGQRRSEASLLRGWRRTSRATHLYSADLSHDAAMRIGGEAPRRQAHSFGRRRSHSTTRVTATSDHLGIHPVTKRGSTPDLY